MDESLENGLPHANNLRVRILFSKPKLQIYPNAAVLVDTITSNMRAERRDYDKIIFFEIRCFMPEVTLKEFKRLKESLLGKRYLPYEKIKLVEFYYQRLNPELDDGNQEKIEWKTSTSNSLWVIYNGMRK